MMSLAEEAWLPERASLEVQVQICSQTLLSFSMSHVTRTDITMPQNPAMLANQRGENSAQADVMRLKLRF